MSLGAMNRPGRWWVGVIVLLAAFGTALGAELPPPPVPRPIGPVVSSPTNKSKSYFDLFGAAPLGATTSGPAKPTLAVTIGVAPGGDLSSELSLATLPAEVVDGDFDALTAMIDARYTQELGEKLKVYAAGGFGAIAVAHTGAPSDWGLGFGYEIKSGVNYEIRPGFSVNAEYRHQGAFGPIGTAGGLRVPYSSNAFLFGMHWAVP